jgi:hypothetical protein
MGVWEGWRGERERERNHWMNIDSHGYRGWHIHRPADELTIWLEHAIPVWVGRLENLRTRRGNDVVSIKRLAGSRAKKIWCYILNVKKRKSHISVASQAFKWLEREICLIPSNELNFILIQNSLKNTWSSVWPNIWALCCLVKLTHKISIKNPVFVNLAPIPTSFSALNLWI